MGAAKARGTYEQRLEDALPREVPVKDYNGLPPSVVVEIHEFVYATLLPRYMATHPMERMTNKCTDGSVKRWAGRLVGESP